MTESLSRHRRKAIRAEGQGGIGGQLLGLSLFIMMLAFFIVMNSISEFDEAKVAPTKLSLEQSFATKIVGDRDLRSSLNQADQMDTGEGSTLVRLDKLFTTQIPGAETVTSTKRGTLYLRLPFAEFQEIVAAFAEGKAMSSTRPLLVPMVALLKADGRGEPYRVDITYNMDKNPGRIANREPVRMEKTIQAAAKTAETIEKAGLPAKLISIGLKEGNADYVELLFSPHIPFNPKPGRAQ